MNNQGYALYVHNPNIPNLPFEDPWIFLFYLDQESADKFKAAQVGQVVSTKFSFDRQFFTTQDWEHYMDYFLVLNNDYKAPDMNGDICSFQLIKSLTKNELYIRGY